MLQLQRAREANEPASPQRPNLWLNVLHLGTSEEGQELLRQQPELGAPNGLQRCLAGYLKTPELQLALHRSRVRPATLLQHRLSNLIKPSHCTIDCLKAPSMTVQHTQLSMKLTIMRYTADILFIQFNNLLSASSFDDCLIVATGHVLVMELRTCACSWECSTALPLCASAIGGRHRRPYLSMHMRG